MVNESILKAIKQGLKISFNVTNLFEQVGSLVVWWIYLQIALFKELPKL